MMISNQNIIHTVLGEVVDYYSRLGGAARPMSMYNSDMPAFIICKLVALNVEEYTSSDFVTSAERISLSIDNKLANITASGLELSELVNSFYKHCSSKLKPAEISQEWLSLEAAIM